MMRVRADMPMQKINLLKSMLIFTIVPMVIIVFIIIDRYYKKSLHEALPMSGVCKDVSMKLYVGDRDKDGKYCTWLNSTYFCAFDPNKDLWSCQVVDK